MMTHQKRLDAIERAQRATSLDADDWRAGKTPEEIAYITKWVSAFHDAQERGDEKTMTDLLTDAARVIGVDVSDLRDKLRAV